MRILLVNKFHYVKGGSETYYFGIADGLRKLGHEIHFFSMIDDKNEACEDSDLFVRKKDYSGNNRVIDQLKDGISLIYSYESKRKFEQIIDRVKPDIIHLNLINRQITWSILDAANLGEIPVVFTSHDYILLCPNYTLMDGDGNNCDGCMGFNYINCVKRKCIKQSRMKSILGVFEGLYFKKKNYLQKIDLIIAPSRYMGEKLVENGVPEEKVAIINNALDERRMESFSCWTSGEKLNYFIYFGRISYEKGIQLLIDAYFKYLNNTRDPYDLYIVGTGPIENDLQDYISKLGISSRVQFLGFKNGEDLERLVSQARYSVVPSTWRETLSYSVIESQAAGTPVIGANIGGIPENVQDGETGYLFDPGNVDSLSNVLKKASVLNSDDYQVMRNACIRHVQDNCSMSRYLEKLERIYSNLIEEKKRG